MVILLLLPRCCRCCYCCRCCCWCPRNIKDGSVSYGKHYYNYAISNQCQTTKTMCLDGSRVVIGHMARAEERGRERVWSRGHQKTQLLSLLNNSIKVFFLSGFFYVLRCLGTNMQHSSFDVILEMICWSITVYHKHFI